MNGGGGAWGVVEEDIAGHREFKPRHEERKLARIFRFSTSTSARVFLPSPPKRSLALDTFLRFHPPRILEFASFCRRRLCEAHQLARW